MIILIQVGYLLLSIIVGAGLFLIWFSLMSFTRYMLNKYDKIIARILCSILLTGATLLTFVVFHYGIIIAKNIVS